MGDRLPLPGGRCVISRRAMRRWLEGAGATWRDVRHYPRAMRGYSEDSAPLVGGRLALLGVQLSGGGERCDVTRNAARAWLGYGPSQPGARSTIVGESLPVLGAGSSITERADVVAEWVGEKCLRGACANVWSPVSPSASIQSGTNVV